VAERPFGDKNNKPTTESLKTILQDAFKYYLDISKVTKSFLHEWNYSKSSGWIEKVHKNKKALYYLIPLENSFKISMAIREKELSSITHDETMKYYHQLLRDAKKYSEGFNVQFEINNNEDYENAFRFIESIITQR
jgi:hypothetical protein